MAFARVQGGAIDAPSSATTVAVTITAVGSGNLICGLVSWDNSGSANLNSVTDDKGNTYNLETTILDTVTNTKAAVFSRTNITNGPVTITATISVSSSFRKIIVDEFSGGSTASTDERDGSAHGGQFQATPGTGTDAITSGTFTTTNNGDLLWGGLVRGGTTALATHGTNFVDGTTNSTSYDGQTEFRTQATAGSGTAATFTANPAVASLTFLIAIKALATSLDAGIIPRSATPPRRARFFPGARRPRRSRDSFDIATAASDNEQIVTLDAVELEPDEPGLDFIDDGALQPVFADQAEIVALDAVDDFEPDTGLDLTLDGALQPVFSDQAEIVALPAEDTTEFLDGEEFFDTAAIQPVFADQAEIVSVDSLELEPDEPGLELTQDAAIQAVFADTTEIVALDAQDDFEPEAGLDLVIDRETDASAADTVTVDKADITLTGKVVVEAETIPIGKASISLAGQAVTEALAVAKADITLAGKAIAETETVAVAKADISLTGKDVGLVDVANDVAVGPAAITIAGGDVLVSDIGVQGGGGDRRKRKSARKVIRDEYGNRRIEALKPTRKGTVRVVSAPATPLPPVAPLTINDEDDETDELLLLLAA